MRVTVEDASFLRHMYIRRENYSYFYIRAYCALRGVFNQKFFFAFRGNFPDFRFLFAFRGFFSAPANHLYQIISRIYRGKVPHRRRTSGRCTVCAVCAMPPLGTVQDRSGSSPGSSPGRGWSQKAPCTTRARQSGVTDIAEIRMKSPAMSWRALSLRWTSVATS